MGRSIALLLALVAGVLLAWSELRLPPPAPADAPAAAFSASRAQADVRWIAARPHPMGSPQNQAVRDRLHVRMAELGLSPRLRRDDVLAASKDGRRLEGGSPETLIGLLPGRDPRQPALAVMAHYDSVPGAPGAADDGAGVAAALEIVRALKTRGVPARDVAVVITDGEEAGLLGARGFFAADPLARRLGFVLNLEARGSGGRTQMFETGRDNGAAMQLFRRTAVRPSAGSLFGEVYARLPNDTDFTLARRAGISGFNYAFTGHAYDYHSPTDSPANLQAGALQDIGQQALAAAQALAFAPALPPRKTDAVYGVLFGGAVVAYPPAWGWAVLAAAAGLIGLALVRAHRLGALSAREVGLGAAALLYMLAGAAAVLHLANLVADGGAPEAARLLAQAHRWEAAQLLLAAGFALFAAAEAARGRRLPSVALPIAVGLACCAAARGLDIVGVALSAAAALLGLLMGVQAIGRAGAWGGVLALGLIAATAVQAFAPQAAYVLAWPLLLGALAAAATSLSADSRRGRLAMLTLLAAAGLGWAGVHAHLIAVVTGMPELLVLPLAMAALVAWPLAQPAAGAPPERLTGRALLFAGAVVTAVVRLASPWDARHPQPSFVAYQLDQDAGRAWRLTPQAYRTPWSDAVLRADGGAPAPFRHWLWEQPATAAPARPVVSARPAIRVQATAGGAEVTIVPPTPPRTLQLQLTVDRPMRLVGVGAAAADVQLAPGRDTKLRWTAAGPDGLRLRLDAPGPGRLKVDYALGYDAWPGSLAAPPTPPPTVAAIGRSGVMLITGSRTLAW